MYVESDIFTAVVMKDSNLWDITPCPLKVNVCCLLHAGFLLDILLNSEDGGGMFPQNVG
jgi:hypothetical protein